MRNDPVHVRITSNLDGRRHCDVLELKPRGAHVTVGSLILAALRAGCETVTVERLTDFGAGTPARLGDGPWAPDIAGRELEPLSEIDEYEAARVDERELAHA